ncbi:MAG TPA: hypothetical protein VLF69_05980 [Candidatus Saccharimonadales bacterium]|nr:hypothetical protein [Candidatus Saccharimonadales bacterium]
MLNLAQGEARSGVVRRHLAELAGILTPLGILSAAEGSALDMLTAPVAYVAIHAITNRVQRRRLTDQLEQVTRWVEQAPDGSSLMFRKDWHITRADIQPDSEDADLLDWLIDRPEELGFAVDKEPASGAYKVTLSPRGLVLGALQHDPDPSSLWLSAFGDTVTRMAESERAVVVAEAAHGDALRRRAFNHGLDPQGEVTLLNNEHREAGDTLLAEGLAAARVFRARHESRAALAAWAVLDKMSNTDTTVTQPHSLEPCITELKILACQGLAQLDLGDASTQELVRDIATHLNGAREHLTDWGQMEQFYSGLCAAFGDKLPLNFPSWNEFLHWLPVMEV